MVIRYVEGMHGMGDNLHQRALIRQWLAAGEEVWLDTPWPEIYHDLPVHCFSTGSRLRTQAKNIRRSGIKGSRGPAEYSRRTRIFYTPDQIRKSRSILKAMAHFADVPQADLDFRMPVPATWKHGLSLPADRPVLVVRPLVTRREWGGCAARNPDAIAYAEIFDRLCGDAYVVSIADLERGKEAATTELPADLCLHKGELNFKGLAALWRDADAVYCSPGFGVVLAQAVSTPVCAVYGGHEKAYTQSGGDAFAPCLYLEPDVGCECHNHHHACDKRITIALWHDKIDAFKKDYLTWPA